MINIELKDVSLAYGLKEVVKDVSFSIKSGEMVGLVGPNGSGKSTIIKALSRVLSPKSGTIILNGQGIDEITRKKLSMFISVVPQTAVLPSAFTAFEIVLMGRNPHLGLFQYESKKDMDIAWQSMVSTSTQHLAQRRIGELSGGEIQSVIIARSLTQQTKAIFLDEPTANLDIGRQIEILDLIKGLCDRNKIAVIAALHDLNLASHYCDKLVLIKDGLVHAEGAPEKVITAENIRDVYGPGSYVHRHPVSGLPAVLPRVGDSVNEKDS